MLIHYFVECPHVGCGWLGYLAGRPDTDCSRSPTGKVAMISFQCPNCEREWRGRAIGADVEALPLEDDVYADSDPVMWPPIDLGVGD